MMATDEQIKKAAQIANIHDFIESLPDVRHYTVSWNNIWFIFRVTIQSSKDLDYQVDKNNGMFIVFEKINLWKVSMCI